MSSFLNPILYLLDYLQLLRIRIRLSSIDYSLSEFSLRMLRVNDSVVVIQMYESVSISRQRYISKHLI